VLFGSGGMGPRTSCSRNRWRRLSYGRLSNGTTQISTRKLEVKGPPEAAIQCRPLFTLKTGDRMLSLRDGGKDHPRGIWFEAELHYQAVTLEECKERRMMLFSKLVLTRTAEAKRVGTRRKLSMTRMTSKSAAANKVSCVLRHAHRLEQQRGVPSRALAKPRSIRQAAEYALSHERLNCVEEVVPTWRKPC
jgi:hypothetical protein